MAHIRPAPERPLPGDAFEWRDDHGPSSLVCRALEPYARHVFTTREWRLGTAAGDDRDAGWRDVADALQLDALHLVRAHQVHGAAVVVRRLGDTIAEAAALPHADILVTDDPAIAVAIQTADCVPLLIADRARGVVAAAHAGWRGLAAGVPRAAVRALTDAFGSRPADLVAAIGPSISAPKYEVDAAVRAAFAAAGETREHLERWFLPGVRPAHWQFDGWRAAADQLEAAGVPRADIHVAALCTATHPQLCSYRRDGRAAGRIAAAVRVARVEPFFRRQA